VLGWVELSVLGAVESASTVWKAVDMFKECSNRVYVNVLTFP
jgi:hypothetical protein